MYIYLINNYYINSKLAIIANDLYELFNLILKQEGLDNPIAEDLYKVINHNMSINDFLADNDIEEFSLDKNTILFNDIPNKFFDIFPQGYNVDDQAIEILKQLGGIYIQFQLPEKLKYMKEHGEIGDTLVICHGRNDRKIEMEGFNSKTAWYVDRSPHENPDLRIEFEDLPINEMPKFHNVMFIFCPINYSYIDYFEFAKKILISGGNLIIVLTLNQFDKLNKINSSENIKLYIYAEMNKFKRQNDINIFLDNNPFIGLVFKKL